jgi:hypothetical protein
MSTIRNYILKKRGEFSWHHRQKRMRHFQALFGISGGERIIDLGGTPEFWNVLPTPVDVTVINLPGYNRPDVPPSRHQLTILEGDACSLPEFGEGSFDIAVSNSVIEHVGDTSKRAMLAAEARRLAPRYWVQTPSVWYPVEAHSYMLFWWFYPLVLRRWLLDRWRHRLPAWVDMMESTTVLSRREMAALFPDADLLSERSAGFVKSYIAVRR